MALQAFLKSSKFRSSDILKAFFRGRFGALLMQLVSKGRLANCKPT